MICARCGYAHGQADATYCSNCAAPLTRPVRSGFVVVWSPVLIYVAGVLMLAALWIVNEPLVSGPGRWIQLAVAALACSMAIVAYIRDSQSAFFASLGLIVVWYPVMELFG